MTPSTKEVLIGLAAKGDAKSVLFVLESLEKESWTEDHLEIFAAVVRGLKRTAGSIEATDVDNVSSAWSRVVARIGPAKALALIDPAEASLPFLDLALPVMDPAFAAVAGDPALAILTALSNRGKLGERTAIWLSEAAREAPQAAGDLTRPLLSELGSPEPPSDPIFQAADRLAQSPEVVERAAHDLLALGGAPDTQPTIGLFRLLALTGNAKYVETVGPYIEDAGAWAYVSRTVFTRDRVNGILKDLKTSEMLDAISRAHAGGNDGTADRLVSDPRFHAAVARLLGSRRSLFALGGLFVDKRVVTAVRAIVSDRDAPIRQAAVLALGALGTETAVPYLVSGTMDRNGKVSSSARRVLRDLIGDERYEKELEAVASEARFFARQLEGLRDWAEKTKSALEHTVSDAVGGAKGTASRLTGAAKRLFRKDKE